ncbi:hypothetical protein, partial [Roseateles sp. P5_E11]
ANDAKLWLEKASKQNHPQAKEVLQLFTRKYRVGPPNKLSVVDIFENAAILARLKADAAPEVNARCLGHTPDSYKAAAETVFEICTSQIRAASGDWIPVDQAKAVAKEWSQCTNREILRSAGISYETFIKCRWSEAPKPQ